MESSPLTLAHSHARNALLETRKSNPVAASEEHDLAAGEFAAASQASADPGALRTLSLLENHHKRLAEILRFQHEHPPRIEPREASATVNAPLVSQPTEQLNSNAKALPSTGISSAEVLQQPPRLGRTFQRDTASSLANNLASARGIPSHPRPGNPVSPTLDVQNATGKLSGSPTAAKVTGLHRKDSATAGAKVSWVPAPISPTTAATQETIPSEPNGGVRTGLASFATDDPFQKFYSTFEGLISKLSAPLAFASLPLGIDSLQKSDISKQKSAAETKVDRRHAAADNRRTHPEDYPDMKKLVSGAALRAIKDRDVPPAIPPHSNPAESFYVVPTSGGTISYAGILSKADKNAREDSFDDNDDHFVDAHEELGPSRVSQDRGTDKYNGYGSRNRTQPSDKPTKTLEELQMENQALKHLSDTLSKRLHMWEVNAQSSSLALQQSLKALHHQSSGRSTTGSQPTPLPVEAAIGQAVTDTDAKIKELEEMVKRGEKDLERVERENKKLRDVLGRYRDRWEKLKEGARLRREGNGSSAGASKPTETPPPASEEPRIDDNDESSESKS